MVHLRSVPYLVLLPHKGRNGMNAEMSDFSTKKMTRYAGWEDNQEYGRMAAAVSK
jgi:hypothetical protein